MKNGFAGAVNSAPAETTRRKGEQRQMEKIKKLMKKIDLLYFHKEYGKAETLDAKLETMFEAIEDREADNIEFDNSFEMGIEDYEFGDDEPVNIDDYSVEQLTNSHGV